MTAKKKSYLWFPIWISAAVAVLFAWLCVRNFITIKDFGKLIDVSINIAGILLGFLITLHGILISIRIGKVMKILKEAGSLPELTGKLKVAIFSAAALLVYCLIILILDFENITGWIYALKTEQILWVFLILLMSVSSYRFISLFIEIITEEEQSS